MEINKLRKEITQLIDNIKDHSDYLSDFERIPQVELEMILVKIKKLYERTIIFNHEYEQEMLTRRVKQEPRPQAAQVKTIPLVQNAAEPLQEAPQPEPAQIAPAAEQVKVEVQAFMPPNEPAGQEKAKPQQEEEVKEEELLLKEDEPEIKTQPDVDKEHNLVEDKPEKKLVKGDPGEHIQEKPVKEEKEEEKPSEARQDKAELNAKFQGVGQSGSLNERIGQGKIHSSLSSKLQMNPISDLTKAIGLNEKFLYIKELFKNDSNAFSEAVSKLNSFHNLAEAEHYLFDELSEKFYWDKKSETVAKFFELVQRRYI
jgi:hypothetical protein